MLTANRSLQSRRRWDPRSGHQKPVAAWQETASSAAPLLCLAPHPAQPEVVLSGSAEGVVASWDLRVPRWPTSRAAALDGPLWSLAFHPTRPQLVCTASDDGSLLLWENVGGAHGAVPAVRTLGQSLQPLRSVAVSAEADAVAACGAEHIAVRHALTASDA